MSNPIPTGAILWLLAAALPVHAQEVNPANPALQNSLQQPPVRDEAGRLRSWEMPTTLVTAPREGLLREEEPIGPYDQPRWTARRLFPSTQRQTHTI